MRIEIVAQHCGATLAEPVDVNDAGEIRRAVVTGELNGLPLGSSLHCAVAEQHKGAIRQLVQPACIQRHAEADAESLAERARRSFCQRESWRWMSLKPAAERAERFQFIL